MSSSLFLSLCLSVLDRRGGTFPSCRLTAFSSHLVRFGHLVQSWNTLCGKRSRGTSVNPMPVKNPGMVVRANTSFMPRPPASPTSVATSSVPMLLPRCPPSTARERSSASSWL